jgi:hypothetical protein
MNIDGNFDLQVAEEWVDLGEDRLGARAGGRELWW